MSFTEFFIRRPAFTIVVSLVLLIIGILSYSALPLRWITNITIPVVAVLTNYDGASASLVESQITTPIEASLSGVNGVDMMFSRSAQSNSQVVLLFKLGQNINSVIEDVRSNLQSITGTFPTAVKAPIIVKDDRNSSPIMFLSFADSKRSNQELSDYVKQFILPRLQTLDGVGSIETNGDRQPAMRIWLDPLKMAAANIAVTDVATVLNDQNAQVPSGQIRGPDRFYNVVTDETLKTPAEFNDLIIRDNLNQVIRIKDIGQAIVDAENIDSAFRTNGQPAIALGIVPQSTANPLKVAELVATEFQKITKALPASMQAKIVFNQADFIKASIQHVYSSLLEAVILVLIVIFIFLGSWRAAIIPIATIPICLVATFGAMLLFKVSINTITLMAFVLAIGLVVDDAIVVLENITRHIEQGSTPFAAAIMGSKEITFPIIAMTITLAAVYAPIAFTSGMLGAVFWDFAITLASAVIFSGVVALTLSPMMSARFLQPAQTNNTYHHWLQNKFLILQNNYQRLLNYFFKRRALVMLTLFLIGLAGLALFYLLPGELAPMEDMNEIDVYISAPRNASFDYTNRYEKQLAAIYHQIPEIKTVISHVGGGSPSQAYEELMLLPKEQRKRSAETISQDIQARVKNISGVNIGVSPASSPLGGYSSDHNGAGISMVIMSSADYRSLHATVLQMIQAIAKHPEFSNINSSLKWDGEQFEVNINREKAADMKISMQDITRTISILLAGQNTGNYEYEGNLYNIIMQMNRASLADPNIVSRLYVRNDKNLMLPLSDLVTVHETTSPESLPHLNRLRADSISMSLSPNVKMGAAIKTLKEIAKDVLPENAKYLFQGAAGSFLNLNGKMALTFCLALIFIYLVLVAQFESFIDPLIVLLTVPFALIGGLLALKLAGSSLNIYSEIALVTLIGLIAKHGILIIEFANHQRELGKTLIEAVTNAATLRLRPILMTTAAMALGALPLALATGPGAETRQQIGWVIVGGILLGTFFSLIVVPVAYTYLAKFKKVKC
jgi:multidrug efflux pump